MSILLATPKQRSMAGGLVDALFHFLHPWLLSQLLQLDLAKGAGSIHPTTWDWVGIPPCSHAAGVRKAVRCEGTASCQTSRSVRFSEFAQNLRHEDLGFAKELRPWVLNPGRQSILHQRKTMTLASAYHVSYSSKIHRAVSCSRISRSMYS